MRSLNPVSLKKVREAHKLISKDIVRTPLVKLKGEFGSKEIYLKLENLQPIGSFKIRGAGTAIKKINVNLLKNGVWTVSAGNMAQGVAWYAKKIGVKCTIIVPDTAPKVKLNAITDLGAKYITVPIKEWFNIMETHQTDKTNGHLIHPFSNENVMAGNGTIGIEIIEDLPNVESVIVPFGGGGLICGIGSTMKQMNPDIKIYSCEPETAAPLSLSLKEGKPKEFDYQVSFVDGMGAPRLFEEMWLIVKDLLSGSLVVSIKEIANAVKILVERNKIITEGAGAASVAAAIKNDGLGKKIVCVISGGNIDTPKIIKILEGLVP